MDNILVNKDPTTHVNINLIEKIKNIKHPSRSLLKVCERFLSLKPDQYVILDDLLTKWDSNDKLLSYHINLTLYNMYKDNDLNDLIKQINDRNYSDNNYVTDIIFSPVEEEINYINNLPQINIISYDLNILKSKIEKTRLRLEYRLKLIENEKYRNILTLITFMDNTKVIKTALDIYNNLIQLKNYREN